MAAQNDGRQAPGTPLTRAQTGVRHVVVSRSEAWSSHALAKDIVIGKLEAFIAKTKGNLRAFETYASTFDPRREKVEGKIKELEAATAEFSRYGLAGARVDRIAKAADSNKAMIYTYFGSKDGLLDAVAVDLIAWHVQDVPFDTSDLPEYAARVFDRYQQHPELMRLVNWDRLKRGGEHAQSEEGSKAAERKVVAIRQAQNDGVISGHFPAHLLLELMFALVELRPSFAEGPMDEQAHAARRQAIKDTVARLIRD